MRALAVTTKLRFITSPFVPLLLPFPLFVPCHHFYYRLPRSFASTYTPWTARKQLDHIRSAGENDPYTLIRYVYFLFFQLLHSSLSDQKLLFIIDRSTHSSNRITEIFRDSYDIISDLEFIQLLDSAANNKHTTLDFYHELIGYILKHETKDEKEKRVSSVVFLIVATESINPNSDTFRYISSKRDKKEEK